MQASRKVRIHAAAYVVSVVRCPYILIRNRNVYTVFGNGYFVLFSGVSKDAFELDIFDIKIQNLCNVPFSLLKPTSYYTYHQV